MNLQQFTNSEKRVYWAVIFTIWVLILGVILWSLFMLWKKDKNTIDLNSELESPLITVRDYLKDQNVTDLSYAYKEKFDKENEEIKSKISNYTQYLYLGRTKEGVYLTHLSAGTDIKKIIQETYSGQLNDRAVPEWVTVVQRDQLTPEQLSQLTDPIQATPELAKYGTLYKVNDSIVKKFTDLGIRPGELVVIWFKRDLKNQQREIESVEKWKQLLPVFKALSLDELKTELNDSQYYTVEGVIQTTLLKDTIIKTAEQLIQRNYCYDWTQWMMLSMTIPDSKEVYYYDQKECGKIHVWGYETENGYRVSHILMSNYYSPEDRDIVEHRYTKVIHETANIEIVQRVYDQLTKEYPLLFPRS